MRVADDEPAKLVGPNGAGPGRAARDANARAGTAYAVTAGADPDARGTSGGGRRHIESELCWPSLGALNRTSSQDRTYRGLGSRAEQQGTVRESSHEKPTIEIGELSPDALATAGNDCPRARIRASRLSDDPADRFSELC